MLALFVVLARAQDLPEGLPEVPAPTSTAATLPTTFDGGWRWGSVGPEGEAQLSDTAIFSSDPRMWAVVGLDGETWLTADGGARWTSVLAPLSRSSIDEDVLVEVQARVQELTSQVDAPSESTYEDGGTLDEEEYAAQLEAAAEQARQLAQQAVSEVQSELEAGPWFLEQQAVLQGQRDRARPRVLFDASGRLLVARADGLRVSEDFGGTWALVLDQSVTSLAELPDGSFVAGLTDGLRVSADLRSWQQVAAIGSERVIDLVVDGGLWVTTGEGAWFSEDRVLWRRLDGYRGEVFTVRLTDPPGDEVGPLVLGAVDTVWHTADPFGSPANATFGGPVPAATSIVRTPGALFAASSAGPWTSNDGGRSWTSLQLGAKDLTESRDVEWSGSLLLLTSAGGLHRLEPVPEGEREAPPVPLVDWVPLGALIDASLGRRELVAHVGRRGVAGLVPEVSVAGTLNEEVGDDWDADTWTLHSVDRWWQVGTQLTWRPGRQRSSTSFDAGSFDSNLSVLVVDGDIVVDDGTSTAVLGSAVRRGATMYRSELAETVGQLWTTRQRLVAEEQRDERGGLQERVQRRLRILELEARLDALTDGAVSDWDPNGSDGGTR